MIAEDTRESLDTPTKEQPFEGLPPAGSAEPDEASKHEPGDTTIPLESTEKAQRRAVDWGDALKPSNGLEISLVGLAAMASVLLEQVLNAEAAHREKMARRARLCWNEDRSLQAEELGATLSRKPSLVVCKLRRTLHGCDWLIGRWRNLLLVLDRQGAWNKAQRALAIDLLGTPREFRESHPLQDETNPDVLAELARREIEALEERKTTALEAIDQHERRTAEAGLAIDNGAETRALRRDLAASRRTLEWAFRLLRVDRRSDTTRNQARPTAKPSTPPAPTAKPSTPPAPLTVSTPSEPLLGSSTCPGPSRPAVKPAEPDRVARVPVTAVPVPAVKKADAPRVEAKRGQASVPVVVGRRARRELEAMARRRRRRAS